MFLKNKEVNESQELVGKIMRKVKFARKNGPKNFKNHEKNWTF